MKSTCKHCSDIVDVLETLAAEFGTSTASIASGLFICLSNGKTIQGLNASMSISHFSEILNKALQENNLTVWGMWNSVQLVRN